MSHGRLARSFFRLFTVFPPPPGLIVVVVVMQVDITLGILIASLTFFRFENGWSASLNGGAASSGAAVAVHKAAYDPRTEKKNAPWVV